MTDSEILSTARYIERLEKIAENYRTQAERLSEENARLMRIAELLETAVEDMEGFSKQYCNACKYCKDEYCTLGRLSECCFEWIHKTEALELLRGEQE